MRIVNVHAAKTHLSSLLEEVQSGQEIVIAKAGKPMAKIVRIEGEKPTRRPGILRGKVWAAPDAWDPDLELERLFDEGDRRFPSALDQDLERASAPRNEDEKAG